MKTKTSCDCQKCKKCCWQSMGWFGSIEEVEGAAKIMNIPVKEFAKKYLIREWWDGEDAFVPAPRKNFSRMKKELKEVHKIYEKHGLDLLKQQYKRNGEGFVVASWAHNLMIGYACIFLTKDQKCAIHESKPRECREAFGCRPMSKKDKNIRLKIARYWLKHQDYINNLLED